MNSLRVCLLLFVMASSGLYAGLPETIEKDSPAQKEMELSVKQKDNPENKNTVMVSVSFKGDEHTNVNLINAGKNISLTKVIKNGMVSVSFEIEKTWVEKGFIEINKLSGARCGNRFLVYLKGYVV